MKRHAALIGLSRDHHHALVVAQRLRRADAETAEAALATFNDFWQEEGQEHFGLEESVLLPALARHRPATDPAIVRVLTDHVTLRRLAGDLAAQESIEPEALHELGNLLEAHIRHEERVLFPVVEAALSDEELDRLAEALGA